MEIKVGYLVSYDYKLLLTSIKQLYKFVDKIYLAIDINKITWSGNKFEIETSFFEKIKNFDINKKIIFYYDNFYDSELTPMECEVRERNMLLKKMRKGGWFIQLDSDEYIYDFSKLKKHLRKYWYLTIFPKITPIIFRGKLVTLFKKTKNGFVFINQNEKFPFITNYNKYDGARDNSKIKNFFTNVCVIHQSWARSEEEIYFKIFNWGHRDDFDKNKYFKFWESINEKNYKEIKNFHPLVPNVWKKLEFIRCDNIDDFITQYSKQNSQNLIDLNKEKFVKSLIKKIIRRK